MSRYFLLLASVAALTSCAYVLDEQIQDITVVTPGAEGAMCYVYIDGLRYKLFPPQTTNVSKSRHAMTVDCLAPGNRRRKVVIEPTLSKHEYMNVANGVVPGAAWDLAADAMFTYPDVITVDFSDAPVLPEAMPAQNDPNIKQPEEYNLEEFHPGLPRLNSDRYNTPTEILRRQVPGGDAAEPYTEGGVTPHVGPGKPSDKGDLKNVIDGLTTPTGSSSQPAAAPATVSAPIGPSSPQPVSTPMPPPVGTIKAYPMGPAAPAATSPAVATPPAAVTPAAPVPMMTAPQPSPQSVGPVQPQASGPPATLLPTKH